MRLLSYLSFLSMLLLFCFWLSPLHSLRGAERLSWQQVEQVLFIADSRDAQGVIYSDTAAFQSVILTSDRPVIRCLKHSDLGKAYYYLGRNYEDYHQRYLSAADCYTRSDQCHMSDPIMRGRVNSCMEWICALGGEYLLAQDYAFKALACYVHSNDSIYYANGLLNIAQMYISEKMYNNADSILSIVSTLALDSNSLTRFYEQKGYYYYDIQQYDSALLYFHLSLNVLLYNPNKFYTLHRMMEAHFLLQHLDSAVNYAHLVLPSSHSLLRANACYVLMEDAKQRDDAEAVAAYAHLRADFQREVVSTRNDSKEGAEYIKQYYEHLSSIGRRTLLVFVIFFLAISILLAIGYTYYERLTRARKEASNKERKIQAMKAQEEQLKQNKREAIEIAIERHRLLFAFDSRIWQDDPLLCTKVDEHLYNFYTRLHYQYKLGAQDLKICLLTLYGASRQEVAACICRAVSSVPKLRANTARKLGTNYPHLRNFLLDYLAT